MSVIRLIGILPSTAEYLCPKTNFRRVIVESQVRVAFAPLDITTSTNIKITTSISDWYEENLHYKNITSVVESHILLSNHSLAENAKGSRR
jgi:hypothetical protein